MRATHHGQAWCSTWPVCAPPQGTRVAGPSAAHSDTRTPRSVRQHATALLCLQGVDALVRVVALWCGAML